MEIADKSLCHKPQELESKILSSGIVLVKGWSGSEESFVDIGRSLGMLERANSRDEKHAGELFRVDATSGTLGVGGYWHADGFAHTVKPARFTLYHVSAGASSKTPTSFIDGFEAVERLGADLCERLERKAWVHTCGSPHRFFLQHQLHDRRAFSVNVGKISSINGLNGSETREVINVLEQILNSMPVYHHLWEPEDLLFVDNQRMLHRSSGVVDSKRVLWRVSVLAA